MLTDLSYINRCDWNVTSLLSFRKTTHFISFYNSPLAIRTGQEKESTHAKDGWTLNIHRKIIIWRRRKKNDTHANIHLYIHGSSGAHTIAKTVKIGKGKKKTNNQKLLHAYVHGVNCVNGSKPHIHIEVHIKWEK